MGTPADIESLPVVLPETSALLEPPAIAAPPAQRLYAFEALRALAMFLVIVIHVGMPFTTPAQPAWFPDPSDHGIRFTYLVQAAQLISLPVFLLMSGFLSRMSYYRHGPREFARARRKYLLVPFAVMWPITAVTVLFLVTLPKGVPLITALIVGAAQTYHLWFLFYLMLFLAGAVVWHLYIDRYIYTREKAVIDRVVRGVFRSPLALLILPLLTLPMLMKMHGPAVDTMAFWVPITRLALYYGVFFVLGWLLQRQPERLNDTRRWRWVSYVVVFIIVNTVNRRGWPLSNAPNWAVRMVLSVFVWSAVFALVGFFLQNLNRPNRAVRFLSDASYWCYLVHMPLVFAYEKQIQYWHLYWVWKFLLLLAATIIPLLVSYALLRRTFIGDYVGGRNRRGAPMPKPATSALHPLPAALNPSDDLSGATPGPSL